MTPNDELNVENVTDRTSNPFGMSPSCERYVSGYGDANADFHVVGDHPGVHGGATTGVPFTNAAGLALQAALTTAGLIEEPGERPTVNGTFLSYLHQCVPEGTPSERAYTDMERFFDAELRAIAAHVLLPVGERATRHVLETYTPRSMDRPLSELHAKEVRGSGFLVYPILDPSEWEGDESERITDALISLQTTDYHRQADLGRFLPTDEPYHVR